MLQLKFLKERTIVFWLTVIFVSGILIRAAITLLFSDNHSIYFEHMLIARNILEGKGYSWDEWGRAILQPTSLVPPLYVYWCVFFQWLSPTNFLSMYFTQAVIAASGCFPAYLIGKRLFSKQVGFHFALLCTFYPEFVFLHSKAVAESIYLVLVLWMIERYSALRSEPEGSRKTFRIAIETGTLCGVAMLVKEAAVIVTFAIMAALIFYLHLRWRTFKNYLIPLLGATIVVLSPWFIRNVIVQGEFIPLRTAYGINWWVANNNITGGNDRTPDGKFVMAELSTEYNNYLKKVLPQDEQDRDRAYAAETTYFIIDHPVQYLHLCAKRFWFFVWFVSNHPLAKNWIYRISWIAVLFGSISGVMILRKRQLDILISLIFIGYLLLYIPVSVLPRYRVIPVSMCLLLTAVTLDFFIGLWKHSRHRFYY